MRFCNLILVNRLWMSNFPCKFPVFLRNTLQRLVRVWLRTPPLVRRSNLWFYLVHNGFVPLTSAFWVRANRVGWNLHFMPVTSSQERHSASSDIKPIQNGMQWQHPFAGKKTVEGTNGFSVVNVTKPREPLFWGWLKQPFTPTLKTIKQSLHPKELRVSGFCVTINSRRLFVLGLSLIHISEPTRPY